MKQTITDKTKAAILTWCDNNGPTNYGQILQCYAMQYLVRQAGYEPMVVQYRKKDFRDPFRHQLSNRTAFGRFVNERYERYYNLKVIEGKETVRVKRFKEFIKKYIPLSPPCYTKRMVEEMTEDCGLLICGSDQIWNPIYFDPVWFLDFGRQEQKRVAYAPSGIFYERPEFETCYRKMAPLIEKLDKVSVREQIGADILKKYASRDIEVKEDPTLLLNRGQWEQVTAQRIVKEKYIFCYLLGSMSSYQMILREIKKKYRAEKIVYIPTNVFSEGGGFDRYLAYEDAGPSEFLSLIRYAEAVCTDSFHGTVMAVQYEVPFYNVARLHKAARDIGGGERIDNFLEKRGIKKRWVRNVREIRET